MNLLPLNRARLVWRAFLNSCPTAKPSYIPRKGLRIAIDQLSHYCKGRILDVGCGCKPYELLFTQSCEYIGLDTRNSGHTYWNDTVVDVFYDGEIIPFPDCNFDTVVSFQVLEHVQNQRSTLSEIRRVLKENGALMATMPFIWSEHEIPFDFQRWSVYGIQNLLEQHGFKIISINRVGGFAEVICSMLIDRFGESTTGFRGFALVVVSLVINNLYRLYRRIMPLTLEKNKSKRFYLDVAVVAQRI